MASCCRQRASTERKKHRQCRSVRIFLEEADDITVRQGFDDPVEFSAKPFFVREHDETLVRVKIGATGSSRPTAVIHSITVTRKTTKRAI